MDIDYFFFYGKIEERAEIEADLVIGLTQDRRSMFYHRGFGAGVSEFENAPISLSSEIAMKYEIASWIANRNLEVSDGTGGRRDRRAITSQMAISIETSKDELSVRVPYIPYFDYEKPSSVSVRVGG